MDKPNKWKAPAWMKPGVRVRVVKGRNWPIGVEGTVASVGTTGNGAVAYVVPSEDSGVPWPAHLKIEPVQVHCGNRCKGVGHQPGKGLGPTHKVPVKYLGPCGMF